MQKCKTAKAVLIREDRNAWTSLHWQRLLRWEWLALAVLTSAAAWLIANWAAGQWLPSTASNSSKQYQDDESPARVSSQILANLPLPVQQQMGAWRDLIELNFAGDQACAECHRSEYDAHRRSGHSHTAKLMIQTSLSQKLTARKSFEDPRRGQEFEFAITNGQFVVRDVDSAANLSVPVTWLLGSGTHAQTPIAVDEASQRGVELRWSYFPDDDRIGLTPDHERFDEFAEGTIECFGRPMDDADIRKCMGCHSTVIPPPNLPVINSMIIANVGCERCHGPRKKHVELAHLGRAEDAKPMLRYETAAEYMAACAACHRDATSITPDMQTHELARFQPYGIQRSRCYLETPGNLTCSTCHDPHDTVSHDRARSITQCNQCHEGGSLSKCSHQPSGDCINCHMPLVPWNSGIAFHDHWIRIPGDTSGDDLTRSEH